MSMQKYYCGMVTPVDDPSWVPDHVNFYVYKTDEVDAHIEALESAAVASALRVKELESLLHRVIEWEPALPAEATLIDEIHSALMEKSS
jgi:hypothetical protein